MTSIPGWFCIAFVLLVLFSGNAAVATEFDFGTLTMSSMKLLGDARLSNGSVLLTRDVSVPYSGAGRILYSRPVALRGPGARDLASFSTFFSFSISNLNPSSIGGGLAFVVTADDDYLGDSGGFLGVTGAGPRRSSAVVAVEFDTLMDVEFKDINGNHVGLDLGSMVSARASDLDAAGVDLKSGDLVNSWVDYSGPDRSIEVYVSYSNLKPKRPVLTAALNLSDHIPDDFAFVGFSGSTQGSTETHAIEWWSFSSSFNESPSPRAPPPSSPLINPSADSIIPPPQPPSNPPNATSPAIPGRTSARKCHSPLCKNGPGPIIGVLTASAFLFALCALALVWAHHKKPQAARKTTTETLGSYVIKMPKEFRYNELHIATKGFDPTRVIGRGSFGTVYKGILPTTRDLVAVKRCSHKGQGKTEFLSELSIIGSLRHRNLVRLQGWCHEKGESLLVYDLMRNGSLDKALFESKTVLPWAHRRKILHGVASALAYLHGECEARVIHRDVKTSNVMLDEGFNARLGDFGLARQVEHDTGSPEAATVAAGTMGYLAPEYVLTGRASEKTDVFSYGAVVLEVVTGRRAIERATPNSNLVEWVWSLHREGRLEEAADGRLVGVDVEDVGRVLKIGLGCANPDPEARPGMRGVVQMLAGEAEVPDVPRVRPGPSYSTSDLLMTLQDSVSDLNGTTMMMMMIELSTSSSSENGFDLV
ncbi:L-type lectin-domain containing receptor kinase VIII.1 [Striga hermonthica]|uniref:non-specific serine/threonine protein kinase n=1 Tax=Striga hermonthica TaxID=68872 RepID=A0A9N7NRY7_STRHE|nr:L-type lectin-domain containing receptor kinase VIII.1 [Striga hermonthica]